MYWLSNLLTPNKANRLKPTFGESYFKTFGGYGDFVEDQNDIEIYELIIRRDTKINIEIVSSFLDYQKLCDFFGITSYEFLNAIAAKSNNMERILNFLNKNINGDTLICNIYMINHEAVIKYHSKHVLHSRVKFLLGHHIVLCIPLTERIYDLVTAIESLKLLIYKKATGVFADYLLSNSIALVDYINIVERSAFEILNELNDYPFSINISVLAELPRDERINDFYGYAAEQLAMITILKLKKLIIYMEEKFFFVPFNYQSRKSKGVDEIKEISGYIIKKLKEFEQWDNAGLLPHNLTVLYEYFTLYKHLYLLALYESNSVPAIDAELEKSIDFVYKIIEKLSISRIDEKWIFKANDENAKDMYQKYLAGWWCVLMTKNTKYLIPKNFYETFVWVVSEETKWIDTVEPILIYNGTDEYLFGRITPQTCNKQKYANGIVFRHPCSCGNDKEINKVWICTTCKEIFQTVDESHIYCKCGVHNFEIQKKWCFKCLDDETKNILFIGQSDAGKSMLINSIHNYLNNSFDEMLKAKTVDFILPYHFRLHTSDSESTVFNVGSEDESEKQKPKVYSLKTENFNIQIIDTPGFDDTRIIDNLNLIQDAIIDIQKLHAICFVIPSFISKFKANFEAHMQKLLLMFSKIAFKNVFFLLTYANAEFSTSEDTINYLKEFIKSFEETKKVEVPFGPENVFCVDNDAFMYLIATKQGHKFTDRQQKYFQNSWNKAKERIEIFLSKLRNTDSVKSDEILMADKVEQIETILQNESDDFQISTKPDNENIFAFPKQVTSMNQEIDAVGIDLGTSRCCVAVNRKSGIETIPLENTGERLLPSYVGYDEINTKCGQIVIDRLRYFSEASVFDSKRIIGRSIVVIDKMWSFKVVNINNRPIIKLATDRGEIQQTATEVAAVLLKYMKEKSDQFQGKMLSKVVITVPAAFTKAQEEATKEAAILAGWESVTLLPEPIAASFAYFVDRPIPNNSILLLFDLGGGTLDVCVFKIINDQIQIVSKNGDSKLGGRDFDNLLMDYFSNKLNLDYGISELGNKKFKLLMECQKIKHNLSVRNDDQLDVEDIEADRIGLIKITQQNFNDLAEDLLNKIQNTIFTALYKSGYKTQQINRVLQVGGGCRMPMIKQLLKEIFPSAEQCCEEHPDEVVAIGAAHYAYNICSI